MTRRARVFNLCVLAAGAIALGFFLRELGWSGVQQAFGVGGWFAVIAAIDALSMMCDAFAIHGFMRRRVEVSYWSVFAAEASGLAINRLTPGNSIGEPVKVTMLAHDVPLDLAVSAIVMFNLATYYIAIAAIVIGVPISAMLLDLPEQVALFVWIATGVLVVLAGALALVVRRGAVGTIIDGAVALHVVSAARGQRWRAKIAAIDARVGEMFHEKSGIHRGLAGVIGSRVLNWVGTIAVLYACDIPLRPSIVIAALSVGGLITSLTNIVPLGIGIADGANYVLYDLLGATSDAGLLFTMVNRLRTVVLAVIGLAIMSISNAVYRSHAQHERVTGAPPVESGQAP